MQGGATRDFVPHAREARGAEEAVEANFHSDLVLPLRAGQGLIKG